MLYVDVDAFSKLAHWNILPILDDLTGQQWHDIVTVSSLWYRAKRATEKPDGRLFYTEEAAKIACDCMVKMGKLPEPKTETLLFFEDIAQIDSGEAVLLSLTIDDSSGLFLTGDKRALRALSTLAAAELLTNRVFTVEQILLLCLDKMGKMWFTENVCPYRHIDKSINIIMGTQCSGTELDIREGLESHINEIAQLRVPSLTKYIGK